jgi:hypothetical protein
MLMSMDVSTSVKQCFVFIVLKLRLFPSYSLVMQCVKHMKQGNILNHLDNQTTCLVVHFS